MVEKILLRKVNEVEESVGYLRWSLKSSTKIISLIKCSGLRLSTLPKKRKTKIQYRMEVLQRGWGWCWKKRIRSHKKNYSVKIFSFSTTFTRKLRRNVTSLRHFTLLCLHFLFLFRGQLEASGWFSYGVICFWGWGVSFLRWFSDDGDILRISLRLSSKAVELSLEITTRLGVIRWFGAKNPGRKHNQAHWLLNDCPPFCWYEQV